MYRIVSTSLFAACLILVAGSLRGQEQDKAKQTKETAQQKAQAEEAAAIAAKLQAIAAMQRAKDKGPGVAAMGSVRTPRPNHKMRAVMNRCCVRLACPRTVPAYWRSSVCDSQGEAKPERLSALIEQLGDKSPAVALKASGELAALARRPSPCCGKRSRTWTSSRPCNWRGGVCGAGRASRSTLRRRRPSAESSAGRAAPPRRCWSFCRPPRMRASSKRFASL